MSSVLIWIIRPQLIIKRTQSKKNREIVEDNENLGCRISFWNWFTFLCNCACGSLWSDCAEPINGYELGVGRARSSVVAPPLALSGDSNHLKMVRIQCETHLDDCRLRSTIRSSYLSHIDFFHFVCCARFGNSFCFNRTNQRPYMADRLAFFILFRVKIFQIVYCTIAHNSYNIQYKRVILI